MAEETARGTSLGTKSSTHKLDLPAVSTLELDRPQMDTAPTRGFVARIVRAAVVPCLVKLPQLEGHWTHKTR